ncbi:hypothetical protein [Pengzhenrongella sp.]|uniref:hypothetical protein n=1 Tax=Pengzhenrongella sp. TaxID=2888820 RepID=UPI002F94DC67
MDQSPVRRSASIAYVSAAAVLSILFVLVWVWIVGVFVGGPTADPFLGTLFWCGLPAAVLSVAGYVAWRRKLHNLAIAVWAGGIGTAGWLALPVFFSLYMGQSSL